MDLPPTSPNPESTPESTRAATTASPPVLWLRRDAELRRLEAERERLEEELSVLDRALRQFKFAKNLSVGQRVWTRVNRKCLEVLGIEPSELNRTGVVVRVRDGEGEALVDAADLDC